MAVWSRPVQTSWLSSAHILIIDHRQSRPIDGGGSISHPGADVTKSTLFTVGI